MAPLRVVTIQAAMFAKRSMRCRSVWPPVYDIVSMTVYAQSTRNMAFRIGGILSLDDLTRASFRQAAAEAGLGERMAMQRYDAMADRFVIALHESALSCWQRGI